MNEEKFVWGIIAGVIIILLVSMIFFLGADYKQFRIQSCMKSLNNIEYCLK